MRIDEIAFKIMAKYMVGFSKLGEVIDLGGALPNDIKEDIEVARSWAKGIIPEFMEIYGLMGKNQANVKINGENKFLASSGEIKNHIIKFIIENKFNNPSGGEYTADYLGAGGVILGDALRSINMSLKGLFKNYEDQSAEVQKFREWNITTGAEYKDSVDVADIVGRVRLLLEKINELLKPMGNVDHEVADSRAREFFDNVLMCSKYIKKMDKIINSAKTWNGGLVNLLVERLISKRHSVNMEQEISKLQGVGYKDASEEDLQRLKIFFEDLKAQARSFDIGNISPEAFANKIVKGLVQFGYVKNPDMIGEAKKAIVDRVSSFIMNDNISAESTADKLINLAEVRSLNRDISKDPAGYSPIKDFKQKMNLSIDEKLEQMNKMLKSEDKYESEFRLIRDMTIEELREEYKLLIAKNREQSLSEAEQHRLGRLGGVVQLYNQIKELQRLGTKRDADQDKLLAKLINQASDIGLKLTEQEEKADKAKLRAFELKQKADKLMENDSNNLFKKSFMALAEGKLKDKDKAMLISNIELNIKKVAKVIIDFKNKQSSLQDVEAAIPAYVFLKVVLGSNPEYASQNYPKGMQAIDLFAKVMELAEAVKAAK